MIKLLLALAAVKNKFCSKLGIRISFFLDQKYSTLNFRNYFLTKNIKNAYLNLVKDLDKKSIDFVDLYIKRIKKHFRKNIVLFLWTKEEREEKTTIDKELNKSVVKHSADLFSYKNYFLPINSFEDKVFYFRFGIRELGGGYSLKNKSIIDAGAYIGDSAIVLSEYTDKKVYAFEPNIDTYRLLLKTIELNKLKDKIVPVDKGLGDRNEKLQICGMNLIENSKESGIDCKMTQIITLDEFVKENNLEIGLIKTDLEGFEPKFLKGAIETIKKQKPAMLISIYHNAQDFFEIKPMIESWNLGYKFKIRKYCCSRFFTETTLICESE
jgi:FkbM family methyltransferase